MIKTQYGVFTTGWNCVSLFMQVPMTKTNKQKQTLCKKGWTTISTCVSGKTTSALDMGNWMITYLFHITMKDLASLGVHSKLNLAHLLNRHIVLRSLADIITYDEDDKLFQKYVPS